MFLKVLGLCFLMCVFFWGHDRPQRQETTILSAKRGSQKPSSSQIRSDLFAAGG